MFQKAQFDGCKVAEGDFKSQKIKIKRQIDIQPIQMMAQGAPECAFDFNYIYQGKDWVCNCNEGRE